MLLRSGHMKKNCRPGLPWSHPFIYPSAHPSIHLSIHPTKNPTWHPSSHPSTSPSNDASTHPTTSQVNLPRILPSTHGCAHHGLDNKQQTVYTPHSTRFAATRHATREHPWKPAELFTVYHVVDCCTTPVTTVTASRESRSALWQQDLLRCCPHL